MSTQLFAPERVPPFKIDSELPAIDAALLQADALRRRFQQALDWQPEPAIESSDPLRTPSKAAVLLPMIQGEDGLRLLLTQRTDQLRHHPGQISFPGGRTETGDADALATALREAREEVGLDEQFVEPLGALPLYFTATGFEITPVVALLRPGFVLRPDPSEVAHVFEVPLSFLMDPRHHRWHRASWQDVERRFLSMQWDEPSGASAARSHFIWGATAAMLRNLYRFLSAEHAVIIQRT